MQNVQCATPGSTATDRSVQATRTDQARERIARAMPGLDGIRGIAVLLVMIHHAISAGSIQAGGQISSVILKLGKAGWIGVDLFFVLSGFLITGSLFRERAHRYYFRNFYGRRVLRIFPLYFIFLICAFVLLAPQLASWYGPAYDELKDKQLWFWTSLQNIYLAKTGGTVVPVGQLWSLAVEEQFYLFWPLILLAFPARRVLKGAIGICLVEIALRAILVERGWTQEAIYTSSLTRLDSLLIGGALAVYLMTADSIPALRRVVVVGLTFIVLALGCEVALDRGFRRDGMALQTFGLTTFACITALAIFSSISQNENAALNRLLFVKWLRLTGRYSYSMYLFHPPIFAGVRWAFGHWGLMLGSGPISWITATFVLIGFICSYLAGNITWRLIEQPILKWRRYFRTAG
jgi:peptidoglycan/LPS O-acetylase OafA/YrhL